VIIFFPLDLFCYKYAALLWFKKTILGEQHKKQGERYDFFREGLI
jgi:hypothetical protein